MGGTMTDYNCERIKLARGVYDMGMKVAAVAIMCQDERVFTAMMNAGTPCPVDGKIGEQAKAIWEAEPDRKPQKIKSKN
jgi:metal-sulfur cluster biosynthetic enzyme